MKMNTAKEVIKTNIQAQMAGHEMQPLVIAGLPGISKTRTVEAITKELGYAFLNVSIPTISSEELSGLPNFVDAPEMVKYSLTKST